jgi:hypothetical protein
MSEHPDFEALSAYHDGEAPELAGHVGGCDACRAELARLAAVSRAVGAPVEAVSPSAVDRMIGRALAAGAPGAPGDGRAKPAVVPIKGPGPDPARGPGPSGPSRSRWAVVAAAAAAVVVAVGLAGVLTRTDRSGGGAAQTALAPAATGDQRTAAPPAAGARTSAGSPIEGGDLGEVVDGRALVAKVGPEVSGQTSSAVADNPVVAPSGAENAPQEVGTRACELQARSIDPGAGPVVYVARATQAGTPATVLGFAPVGGSRPLSLFLMAQDGCRLLAQATLP